MASVEILLQESQHRVNAVLEQRLPREQQTPERLHRAMRYAVLGAGKRIRPALVYTTGTALGVSYAALDRPAGAVELIHAYSLAHDDLPAMDDDDLRRGRATCHRAFDEATAILVGDALQSLAFEWVAEVEPGAPVSGDVRAAMAATLARAAGPAGMVGGQDLDLAAAGQQLSLAALERVHRYKTGALLRASVTLGGLAGGADSALLARLDDYAAALGLAFQIVDDILDVTVDTATLGKTQGADIEQEKCTYPALLGTDGARDYAWRMHDEAQAALTGLPEEFDDLRGLATFVVERTK